MPKEKKEKRIRLSGQQLANAYRNEQIKTEVLQRKQQRLQQALNESLIASEAIEEIRKKGEGTPVLVSLGAGVYADAKLVRVKKVKDSLAGYVLVDKQSAAVLQELEAERKRLQQELLKTNQELGRAAQSMNNLAAILQKAREEAAKHAGAGKQEPGSISSVS